MESNNDTLKSVWAELFKSAPVTLSKMKDCNGVISCFNSCIDAVKTVKPENLEAWIKESGATKESFDNPDRSINNVPDLLRGVIECWREGKAAEWCLNS